MLSFLKTSGASLMMLFMVASCVGTVQDSAQTYSNIVTPGAKAISFPGVASVSPISDTRIEVFFYPASGGSGKFIYDVTVGSSPYPLSFPSDVLLPDYRGLLRLTLSGLSRLTAYQIKVEARDTVSTAVSNSQVVKVATTFDNQVANFGGITSAYNMPGQDGKDSLRIRWTPAATSGGITKQVWDPKTYEVIVVDSELLTPADMDTNFTNSQGRFVYAFNHDDSVNEYIIRGLPSSKRFYIRMRCLHEGGEEDVYNPRKRSELNTKYITMSTLSDSLADLNFQPASFAVALAPGEQGLTAINNTWSQASGVFDHFRLYYSLEGGGVAFNALPALCLSPATSPVGATVFCKKVDLTSTSSPITGLSPYSTYEVALVLCQTTACGPSESITSPTRTIVTDPQFPTFSGIKAIDSAYNLSQVGSVYLKYDPPNFTTGYFDGMIIKVRRTADGSDAEVLVTPTTDPVANGPYNFILGTNIEITGIDYLTDQPYCFTIYPYKYDTDGVTKREMPNGIWKCILPQVLAPTALQFTGLSLANTSQDTVSLTWPTPTTGVFAFYEIFWRKHNYNFNWGDAIGQAATNSDFTNYGRQLIPSGTTSTILNGFDTGDYAFGMTTYYSYVTDSGAVILRSETNSSIFKCHVDNSSVIAVNCVP
jgi:hypothetical protein